MNNRITIFTPTYNRAITLETAYKSLLNQSNKDFIWLIIDDGSTDQTQNLVKHWIKENKINIEYHYKKNGGKHTAYNYMLDKVKTDFVLISLDSDDYLLSNAIEKMYKHINEMNGNMVGISFLSTSEKNLKNNFNQRVTKYNLNILKGKSLKWGLINNEFDASCLFLFNINYLINFRYPEINYEKFFTEAYTYYQMDEVLLWTDEIVCVRIFRNDGYTNNTIKLFKKNPTSWYMYNTLRANTTKVYKLKIKYITYSIMFARMLRLKIKNININNKILLILLYPVGIFGKKILENKKC